MDHFTAVGNPLVLAHGIRHDRYIVDGDPDAGRWKLVVGVATNRLLDVPHQGGMSDKKVVPLMVSPRIKETA
jgi:hypothetical protein